MESYGVPLVCFVGTTLMVPFIMCKLASFLLQRDHSTKYRPGFIFMEFIFAVSVAWRMWKEEDLLSVVALNGVGIVSLLSFPCL